MLGSAPELGIESLRVFQWSLVVARMSCCALNDRKCQTSTNASLFEPRGHAVINFEPAASDRACVIPMLIDQNLCGQSRIPMDMMDHG